MNQLRQQRRNVDGFFANDERREGPGLRRAAESGVFVRAPVARPTDTHVATTAIHEAAPAPPGGARQLRWRIAEGAMPMLIFVRGTGAIVAANEAAARAYGFTHEELLASSIADLVPPSDSLAERLLRIHHLQTRWTAPLLQYRKDGSTFLAEMGLLEAGATNSATMVVIVKVQDEHASPQADVPACDEVAS